MAKEESFDVVSKADLQEVGNAVNQAQKELETRFDFKGSHSSIELSDDVLTVISDDEYKLASVLDIVQSKLIKRGVSLKSLDYGKIEPAAKGTVRQVVKVKQGLDQDVAKQIVKLIKDAKLKVQASIQGDQVRVSAKSRDDLQDVIQLLKQQDYPADLQFTNYR
ncbi:MAG: YajQ family cyclic di-GMP-binding protein [Firmicutes bacterium]|nr:YajQ family cyclic di-GMP-binding protein [Bacillota bacterium]